mmetsp:Transcript_9841/g.31578  ORF Transcript_9841/g.31578 Transcript_9841/m.31578 type:complete len:200 (+) Transcript_9841:279-878(+)
MFIWTWTSVWAACFWSAAMVACMAAICFSTLRRCSTGTMVPPWWSEPWRPRPGWSSSAPPRGPFLPLPLFLAPEAAAEVRGRLPPAVEPSSLSARASRFLEAAALPGAAALAEAAVPERPAGGAGAASWRQAALSASSKRSRRSRAAWWTGASGRTLKVRALRKTRRTSATTAWASAYSWSSRRRLTVPRSIGAGTMLG